MNYDQPNNSNSSTFYKVTGIIYAALLTGQVLFAVVAFFIAKNMGMDIKPGGVAFFYVAPLLIISGIFAGSFAYKQQLAKLSADSPLNEKLTAYQIALIIRCALSEGACLFCIVSYILTGNLFYLVLAGLNILYFIWIRPTKEKIADDLSLSYEDKIELGW